MMHRHVLSRDKLALQHAARRLLGQMLRRVLKVAFAGRNSSRW
jgi:hypothetical protein